MKDQIFQNGNTFDTQSFAVGHARKVWRRIEEQLPGGFVIKNVSDFASVGLIRSGLPVAYDTTSGADAKDIKVLKWSDVTGAESIDSLNIIGFLQEDVPVLSASTIATGNVIVKGEIYGYMLGDTPAQATSVAAAVKGMAQKNGLNIRVVD